MHGEQVIRFCGAIVLLAAASGGAHALPYDSACAVAQNGNGYLRVGNGYIGRGQEWTYVLKLLGSNWRIGPPDRHSSGHIFCDNCGSDSTGFGGEFNWGSWPRPPSTAAERAERRTESIPQFVFRRNQLEVRGTRKQVSLGPLCGYAVLYRTFLPHIPQQNEPPAAIEGSLIAIYLTDGCIDFETHIFAKPNADGNDWLPLDSLLTGVTIEKSPSSETEIPARNQGATTKCRAKD